MSVTTKAALAAGFAALIFSTGAQAQGPSFSCRGRLKLDERIICYDPELARMDQRVADLYRDAGGPSYASPEVHAFIKDRLIQRADCETADCIRDILREEIDYLKDHAREGGDRPQYGH